MKQIRWSLLVLMAAVCLSVSAKGKKKKVTKPVAAKVDTLTVKDFSYAYGMANTLGFKEYLAQRMNVDTTYMADFLRGYDQATDNEESRRAAAYAAGITVRGQLKEQVANLEKQITEAGVTIDNDAFVAGFRAQVSGENCLMTMDSAQNAAQRQMRYYHETIQEKKYGANRLEGEAFLKQNRKKDSVQVTASGLQYKVLVKGTGAVPQKNQTVKVNYEGHLVNGTEFDSSYKRKQPASFRCDQVIKGWTEALTMMPVGSKWELYIPQELGYGPQEAGKIPPFSTLIFTVELLDIVK